MRLPDVMLSATSHSIPTSTLIDALSTIPSHWRFSRPVQALSWTREISFTMEPSIQQSPSLATSSRSVNSTRNRGMSSSPTTSCSSYAITTSTRRRGLFSQRHTTVSLTSSLTTRTLPVIFSHFLLHKIQSKFSL